MHPDEWDREWVAADEAGTRLGLTVEQVHELVRSGDLRGQWVEPYFTGGEPSLYVEPALVYHRGESGRERQSRRQRLREAAANMDASAPGDTPAEAPLRRRRGKRGA